MIEVSLAGYCTLLVTTLFGLLLGLWLFYDHRDKKFYDTERSRWACRCRSCGKLYEANVNPANCPSCATSNPPLRF